MLYPLFFQPIYKSIIWGGRNLERVFNRTLPEGKIAESWDICSHKNGTSIVSNGGLMGKSLQELTKEFSTSLLGTKFPQVDKFPLLVKIIDANDKLSVQVHPGDSYALQNDGDLGKTEMWYVIDAKEDAKLIYGTLPGTTKEEFKSSIEGGVLEKHLKYTSVKKGDVIFIPSGTVHAIMDGLLIAEIQQNSDTTYRVYDWNRVDDSGTPRQLHISKALDVINFDFAGEIESPSIIVKDGYNKASLVHCNYFNVDKIVINDTYEDMVDGSSFFAFTAVEGNGYIEHNNVKYDIQNGCSFLIPASIGKFTIKGNITLLKSYL